MRYKDRWWDSLQYWKRKVFPDALFVGIGKATGTGTLQLGNWTISVLQRQVLQGNSIASKCLFLTVWAGVTFYDGAALYRCHHAATDPPLPWAVTHVRWLRQFLTGKQVASPQRDGREWTTCCLQLFTRTQTSCHYWLYAGKPAGKALGIWQYSAEGWLSHKFIQIQCLRYKPIQIPVFILHLPAGSLQLCRLCISPPVPLLSYGPGKN